MKWYLLGFVCSVTTKLVALTVINDPSVIVYETPEKNAHIEDIIPYGTVVTSNNEKDGWVYVQYPGYHGWVQKSSLIEADVDPASKANAYVGFRGVYVYEVADTEWGPFLHLPFETPLEIIDEPEAQHKRWLQVRLQDGKTGYVSRSQVMLSKQKMSLSEMVNFSKNFIGTKYLWGGTTSFGYDCSSFVKMLYRQMGVTLQRDSKDQFQDLRFVDIKSEDAQEGDLVFFKNASGKVVHVAMMINSKEFIHAFPKGEGCICTYDLLDERFKNGYYSYGIEIKRMLNKV